MQALENPKDFENIFLIAGLEHKLCWPTTPIVTFMMEKYQKNVLSEKKNLYRFFNYIYTIFPWSEIFQLPKKH